MTIVGAIIAIFVLFSANGNIAVTTEINHWNYVDCSDYAKWKAIDWEEAHKGDRVEGWCQPVYKYGI